MLRRIVPCIIFFALLGGCATPETPPPPVVIAPPPPVEVPPAEAPPPRQDKLKHLAHRKLEPLPQRPLNAKAKCHFRDETGYRGRLQLDVKEASVKRFEAKVDVPKHGSCNFRLQDFQQTDSMPNVVLAARRGECKVSLWEQEHQVTVAFRDCRHECSGNSVEYLWPILVDNRKGSCS